MHLLFKEIIKYPEHYTPSGKELSTTSIADKLAQLYNLCQEAIFSSLNLDRKLDIIFSAADFVNPHFDLALQKNEERINFDTLNEELSLYALNSQNLIKLWHTFGLAINSMTENEQLVLCKLVNNLGKYYLRTAQFEVGIKLIQDILFNYEPSVNASIGLLKLYYSEMLQTYEVMLSQAPNEMLSDMAFSMKRGMDTKAQEVADDRCIIEIVKNTIASYQQQEIFPYDRYNTEQTLETSKKNCLQVGNFLDLLKTFYTTKPYIIKVIAEDDISSYLGTLFKNIADYTYSCGDNDKCLGYLEGAFYYLESKNDSRSQIELARAYHIKGNVFNKLTMCKDAEKCYYKAYIIFEAAGATFDIAMLMQSYGRMLCKNGKIKEGIAKYDNAINNLIKISNVDSNIVSRNMAIIYHELGNVYLYQSGELGSTEITHAVLGRIKENLINFAIHYFSKAAQLKVDNPLYNKDRYPIILSKYKLSLAYREKSRLYQLENDNFSLNIRCAIDTIISMDSFISQANKSILKKIEVLVADVAALRCVELSDIEQLRNVVSAIKSVVEYQIKFRSNTNDMQILYQT